MKAGLVIGLGGTGVSVIQHIKARLTDNGQHPLPPNVCLLALDTVQDQGWAADTDAILRSATLETGSYPLIASQHVYDDAPRAHNNRRPRIASWFQSETYLGTLSQDTPTLQSGAGQLRQFGRLAVFRDVAVQANTCKLIINAIANMRKTDQASNPNVFLIGSVAGGTGAGVFVDIAYLVQKRAQEEQISQKVTLRTFLVLPEACSGTPPATDNALLARSYASMREIQRFVVDSEWHKGYPLNHQVSEVDGAWRSEMKTKPFDSLYYVDGLRANELMTNALSEFDVNATIADTIVAMLDDSEDCDQLRSNGDLLNGSHFPGDKIPVTRESVSTAAESVRKALESVSMSKAWEEERLMQLCPGYGGQNEDVARFYHACGRRLAVSLAVGDVFQDRCRIIRQLGEGGMSTVYLAEDTPLDNRAVNIATGKNGRMILGELGLAKEKPRYVSFLGRTICKILSSVHTLYIMIRVRSASDIVMGTISVTELRNLTREAVENAHFRNRRYVVERAGQPMVVVLGIDEYKWLVDQTPTVDNSSFANTSVSAYQSLPLHTNSHENETATMPWELLRGVGVKSNSERSLVGADGLPWERVGVDVVRNPLGAEPGSPTLHAKPQSDVYWLKNEGEAAHIVVPGASAPFYVRTMDVPSETVLPAGVDMVLSVDNWSGMLKGMAQAQRVEHEYQSAYESNSTVEADAITHMASSTSSTREIPENAHFRGRQYVIECIEPSRAKVAGTLPLTLMTWQSKHQPVITEPAVALHVSLRKELANREERDNGHFPASPKTLDEHHCVAYRWETIPHRAGGQWSGNRSVQKCRENKQTKAATTVQQIRGQVKDSSLVRHCSPVARTNSRTGSRSTRYVQASYAALM